MGLLERGGKGQQEDPPVAPYEMDGYGPLNQGTEPSDPIKRRQNESDPLLSEIKPDGSADRPFVAGSTGIHPPLDPTREEHGPLRSSSGIIDVNHENTVAGAPGHITLTDFTPGFGNALVLPNRAQERAERQKRFGSVSPPVSGAAVVSTSHEDPENLVAAEAQEAQRGVLWPNAINDYPQRPFNVGHSPASTGPASSTPVPPRPSGKGPQFEDPTQTTGRRRLTLRQGVRSVAFSFMSTFADSGAAIVGVQNPLLQDRQEALRPVSQLPELGAGPVQSTSTPSGIESQPPTPPAASPSPEVPPRDAPEVPAPIIELSSFVTRQLGQIVTSAEGTMDDTLVSDVVGPTIAAAAEITTSIITGTPFTRDEKRAMNKGSLTIRQVHEARVKAASERMISSILVTTDNVAAMRSASARLDLGTPDIRHIDDFSDPNHTAFLLSRAAVRRVEDEDPTMIETERSYFDGRPREKHLEEVMQTALAEANQEQRDTTLGAILGNNPADRADRRQLILNPDETGFLFFLRTGATSTEPPLRQVLGDVTIAGALHLTSGAMTRVGHAGYRQNRLNTQLAAQGSRGSLVDSQLPMVDPNGTLETTDDLKLRMGMSPELVQLADQAAARNSAEWEARRKGITLGPVAVEGGSSTDGVATKQSPPQEQPDGLTRRELAQPPIVL